MRKRPYLAAASPAHGHAAWLLLLIVSLHAEVHAARPMLTDDARVVDDGHCQMESWTLGRRSAREWWSLPGCNVGSDTEWTLGGQQTRASAEQGSSVLTQVKTLVRELKPGTWGLAFTLGAVVGLERPQPFLNIPISWLSAQEGTVLHVNVGASARPDRGAGALRTWGAGVEHQVTDSAWLIAERYSAAPGQSQSQAGLRWWLLPSRLQIDATGGEQREGGSSGRFFSVGLRWIFRSPF